MRIAWNGEAEVAVSRDRAIALQPGNRVRLSQKKQKKRTGGKAVSHMTKLPASLFPWAQETWVLRYAVIYIKKQNTS